MKPLTIELKAVKFPTTSDLICNEAIKNQGKKGEPIFFGEISFHKRTKKGNSIKTFKTHYKARKIVFSGQLANVKTDEAVLLSCLNFIFDKKKAFAERQTGSWFIDSINIKIFLGYGFK